MFIYDISALIQALNEKTPATIPTQALLYSLVPNAAFGYPMNSTGEFNTQEEYDALLWDDERSKPSWEELNAHRQALLELELAIDLDQLRERRYRETVIHFQGNEFNVSPTGVCLLDSQIRHAETEELGHVPFLDAKRKVISLSLTGASELLAYQRKVLNQWVIDPRVNV